MNRLRNVRIIIGIFLITSILFNSCRLSIFAIEENLYTNSNQTNANYFESVEKTSVIYSTHIQDIGWQDNKFDGQTSGTINRAKRLEAIKINLKNSIYEGKIEYSTHIQDIGWQGWKENDQMSGTSGQSKRLEAIQIKLTGEIASKYDIYYRVHVQEFGWLDWAKNGASAGSAGYSYRLEAIEIKLIVKNGIPPGLTTRPFVQCYVSYSAHVQDYGWQNKVYDGMISGTTGQAKQLEAIKITLENPEYEGSIQYRSHIEDYGWESSWKTNGQISGTNGQSKQLEAIQIKITGEMSNHYDIYYRVHVENLGWMGWTKNGEKAGTAGYAYRIEAVEIKLVKKGGNAPGNTNNRYKQRYIGYLTHVEDYGWQTKMYDGMLAGTSGKSKRLEAIKITLENPEYEGSIQYRSHIEDYGWESSWKTNGQISGTNGQSKRLEAIQIKITEEMSNYYDVYYRVHVENLGWLGWAKNGESAGTEGYSYRLEGIEVRLAVKGDNAPGDTNGCFYKYNSWVSNLKAAQTSSQLIIVSVSSGSYANISMHSKSSDGYWKDDYSVAGRVGRNGIGKLAEGDGKTPTGIFSLHTPFGIKSDPGCPLGYIQVNNNHYWGGGNPEYYNKLVDASTIINYNPSGSEHIIDYGDVYNYCIAVGYNMEQIVGKGSAIFLHCSGKGATGGCISISEDKMIYTLRNLKPDAKIIIDYNYNISKY